MCGTLIARNEKISPRKDVATLCEEFHKVLSLDKDDVSSASQYEEFLKFAERWSAKNPRFGRYCKEKRNAMYFTFLDYAPKFHRMIYTTNWIERLNRSYKRTFPMVLLALTNSPHRTKYISEKELEAKLTEILGANWRDFLYEYKKKLKGPPQTTQEID